MNIEITYDKLLYFFEHGDRYSINETTFYFDDDPEAEIHYIGYMKQYEKPYWAGYCDIPDGCDFLTAEELFTARIYNQQSIKERWKHLILVEIGGISAEDWFRYCRH